MTRRPRAQARTKRAAILNPPTSPVAAGFLVGLGVSPAALDVVRNPAVVRTLRHSAIVPHLRRLRPTEGLARPPIPGTPRVPVLTDIPGCTAISPVPYPLMSFPLAYRAGHARPLTLASRELSAAHPARHTQLANAVFPIRLQSTSACKREAESRGNTRGWCDAGINLVPAAHHLQGPRLTSTADGHLRSNGTAWFATPSLPKPYRDRPRVLARGLEYFPRGTPAGFTIIRAAAGQLPGDHVPAVFVLSGNPTPALCKPTQPTAHLGLPKGVSPTRHRDRRFAGSTSCTRADCSFAHKCWLADCLGDHPGKSCPRAPAAPGKLQAHTPLRHSEFEKSLSNHPDKAWVSWLLHSIKHGISLGFSGPRYSHKSHNLTSAYQHPDIISSELSKEIAAGRVLGPFTVKPLINLRISGLGAAPKKNGKWRVILHLSAPYSAV
ncbi:hypothetical protein EMCRGX_G004923 [Ephydatia muelleri]